MQLYLEKKLKIQRKYKELILSGGVEDKTYIMIDDINMASDLLIDNIFEFFR